MQIKAVKARVRQMQLILVNQKYSPGQSLRS